MSIKPVTFFLPSYEKERRIQCDIPATLAAKVDIIRRQRRITWSELITGMLEKVVDDINGTHRNEAVALQTDIELEKILRAQRSA